MISPYLLFFVLLIIINAYLPAQNKIVDEIIKGGSYKIILDIAINYNLKKNDNRSKIFFDEHFDESKPGQFFLPQKEIFVSIPHNLIPDVSMSVLEYTDINALPIINPQQIINDDKTITYKEFENPLKNEELKDFEIKGTLWHQNNFYVHITLHPVKVSGHGLKTRIIKTVELKLEFPESVELIYGNEKAELINRMFITKGLSEASNNTFNKESFKDGIKSNNWFNLEQSYIKLGVAQDGIFRITPDSFSQLGVNLSTVQPSTVKLFLRGNQVPIFVKGEDDGAFDEDDYIEFIGIKNYGSKDYRKESEYGKEYNEYLNRYSDTTVYWLTWGGEKGERIKEKINTVVNNATPVEYYYELSRYERNEWFDFAMDSRVRFETPDWFENKTWNDGTQQSVGVTARNIQLSNVYKGAKAKAFAKVCGYVSNVVQNAHHLGMSINGDTSIYDSSYVNRFEQKVLKAEFNSDILSNGTNKINIHSFQTTSSFNVIRHDWFEFEYPRYLSTVSDSVNFQYYNNITNGTNAKFIITNLHSNELLLYKMGNNNHVKKIENLVLKNDSLFVYDTLSYNDRFFLTSKERVLTPKLYYVKKFADLSNSNNNAEYILITHPKFLNIANQYSDFISSSYNLISKTINVFDIYDEFNYGFFAPEPIKDFLKSAFENWANPKPKHVFLVGDANYDFYGNRSRWGGAPYQPNYVPSYGAPVSDNWFVTWDTTGAYIPNMSIGRLPINSNEEFLSYFEKHKDYVESPFTIWNKSYIFFSGGNASEINTLKNTNDNLIRNYIQESPIGGQYTHFYKTINPATNFGPYSAKEVNTTIDKGALLIFYLGHSGTQTWDNGIVDSKQLNNSVNKNPLITDFGCSTAKFAEPDIKSFSENFVSEVEGQAIAYVGNSSLGFLSTAVGYPDFFFKKLFVDNVLTIGKAHSESKLDLLNNYGSTEIYKLFALTNTLIGDPIIKLSVPPKPNFIMDSQNIILGSEPVTDDEDSLTIKLNYHNYGKVTNDSLVISVSDEYNNQLLEKSVKREVPKFADSLNVMLSIKDKPGQHLLKIELDVNNNVDELNENDNLSQISYSVNSSSIRPLFNKSVATKVKNPIMFLSPTIKGDENFSVDISESSDFSSSKRIPIDVKNILSVINLDDKYNNKRIWLRVISSANSPVNNSSFEVCDRNSFIFNDSLSFNKLNVENFSIKGNELKLDTLNTIYNALSAGFNDGNTAVISKNGENFIPENTKFGYHVCVFNAEDNSFQEYHNFNLYDNGLAGNTDFINLLDSLTDGQIVIIAISGDGSLGLTKELRNKFKEFGSYYADSISFRSSWSFIGMKNSIIGSMPEEYNKQYNGRVEVDTIFTDINKFANFKTEIMGPVGKWVKVSANILEDEQSTVKLTLRLIDDNDKDTVLFIEGGQSLFSLENLADKKYKFLQIEGDCTIGDMGNISVLSIEAEFNTLPELATNYQVVSISQDSVNIGENIDLNFDVYNVGESPADSFYVEVDLVNENNTTQTNVFKELVTSIDSLNKKSFSLNYNTVNLSGNYKFNIKIDTEDKILELYKDNNFYSIPFYVKPDTTKPTLNLTLDGKDIFDGEYISPKPNIKVELTDLSLVPVTDTSSVKLFLDDDPVFYANNNYIHYEISNSNPKYTVEFKPELADGEHSVTVFAKDASGNFAEQNGLTKNFVVSNQVKLLDLYNYPNPFSSDTYFTFKLTQVPDHVRIKVYTIAGRLVKEISKTSAELNYDFNKIYWDGRDEDGDLLGNGVYIYRAVIEAGGVSEDITQKLAIVR